MAKEPEERIAELQEQLGELRAARAQDKKALETREHENRDFRAQVRQLEQQVSDLNGRIPQEGSVIISSDEAAAYQQYQEFGDLTSIKTKLESLEEARAVAKKLQRRDALRGVAEAEGWKLAVLEDLTADIDLNIATVENETQVTIPQAGKAAISPREFIEQFKADYVPSLQAAPTSPLAPVGPGPSSVPSSGEARRYTDEEIAAEKRAAVSI
jgi:predicted  nucleic acid-binding Zn-ribbon protein